VVPRSSRHPRRRRPIIIAGGGAIYLVPRGPRQLATRFGIPVTESQAGKGVLPWNHPLNAGLVEAAGARRQPAGATRIS
jgi:3D-(3,5/4)-trihydroxycyclohexane-1,2-dione acylhydrolase (decyclizing)